MYEYVFFDLDGTLTDPAEGITTAVCYALKKFNIEIKDKSTLNYFIGPPLHATFMSAFNLSYDEASLAVKYYREYYCEKGLFQNVVYPGTHDMLFNLKKAGKKLAVATSKPESYSLQILQHFDLLKYFDCVCGAGLTPESCIKADIIARAINELGALDKSRVLMVGDREHDVFGAKQNGIDCVGVTFGYGSESELISAGAVHISNDQNDILRFVLGDK